MSRRGKGNRKDQPQPAKGGTRKIVVRMAARDERDQRAIIEAIKALDEILVDAKSEDRGATPTVNANSHADENVIAREVFESNLRREVGAQLDQIDVDRTAAAKGKAGGGDVSRRQPASPEEIVSKRRSVMSWMSATFRVYYRITVEAIVTVLLDK